MNDRKIVYIGGSTVWREYEKTQISAYLVDESVGMTKVEFDRGNMETWASCCVFDSELDASGYTLASLRKDVSDAQANVDHLRDEVHKAFLIFDTLRMQ